MKSELKKKDRRKIRMYNYWAFLAGAFVSLVFAAAAVVINPWSAPIFVFFSGWLFRLMHLSAFPELKDTMFEIPAVLSQRKLLSHAKGSPPRGSSDLDSH